MGGKRIGLYGGTFDPVHNGHLAVARELVKTFRLDEVRFIPAYSAPHKRQRETAPALQRYAMLALATRNDAALRVSTIELEAPARPYTVETLTALRATEDAATRLFFIMGADSWAEIDTWREYERVLELSDHLVVTRPGFSCTTDHVSESIRRRVIDVQGMDGNGIRAELERNAGPNIFISDLAFTDVSATAIRRAVGEASKDWLENVPAEVVEFIKKYGLYK
jgi:nicotinate-nucleotide adenylyltransferase